MLAMLHTSERNGSVHEIGNADRTGIDVLAFLFEHHAEIFVLRRFVETFEIRCRAALVHVAERDDVLGLRGIDQIDASLSPQPMDATFSLS